jgi:hypothetical protein
VGQSEGVLEVPDGEEEREELPESDDKGDSETGTLTGENKDVTDAEVLGDHIANEPEDHVGDGQSEDRDGDWGGVETDGEMSDEIRGEEEKARERESVRVEESFFGMFAILTIDNLLVDTHTSRHEEGECENSNTYSHPELVVFILWFIISFVCSRFVRS